MLFHDITQLFQMELLLLFIITILFVYLLRLFIIKHYNFWDDRGVKTNIKPYPLIGSLFYFFLKRKPLHEMILYIYNKYPNESCVGFYQMSLPTLLLRDPDLIKEINVKEFDSFMDRRVVFSEDTDPTFGKNLLSLKGERWKNMRSTLSPAFTSSKMKIMVNLINDCSQNLVKYVLKEAERNNNVVTLEMKEAFTRYTNDVIASTAFGIEVDSFINKENEIYVAGKKVTNFSGWMLFKIILLVTVPKFAQLLGFTFLDKNITKFFHETITTNIKIREEQGIVRPDMLHLLIEARKKQLKHEDVVEEDTGFAAVEESSIGKAKNNTVMTDEDIVAQAFLFFFAGYETSSTAMGFLAYELAVNPDIQKKLQAEIDESLQNSDGKLDYDIVRSMKYLDMVVSESLRKWPPGIFTERICNKPHILKNEDGREMKIDSDVSTWTPVYALHHDPKYFPNPERFDAERFNDENKSKIVPFTYLPFGAGPRNCIGSRFALLEVKLLFIRLLERLDLVVVKETQIPPKLDKTKLSLSAAEGIWIGFKPREC